MKYQEIKPTGILAHYVKCFWTLERTYHQDEKEIVWPDGNVELLFHYGSRYYNKNRQMPHSFVIGPLTKYMDLISDGHVSLMGVRFQPWGFASFFRETMKELTNQMVPLETLIGYEAKLLEEMIYGANKEEALSILEKFLVKRLTGIQNEIMIPMVSKLKSKKGNIHIKSMAEEFYISERQMERFFRQHIGVSPKKLSTILRFDAARTCMIFAPHMSMQEIMYKFGYYDYSHFTKDFRNYLGMSPKEYHTWIKQIKRDGKDVAFLQESEE
ncbi:AraC family transcriptional regulator [Bacillus pfraonensis]|uniref:AraC family transcriptional regulator n=1 Tax=Bacillus TaxID=1386 RepID=UPI0030131051